MGEPGPVGRQVEPVGRRARAPPVWNRWGITRSWGITRPWVAERAGQPRMVTGSDSIPRRTTLFE
jgi:hypothetical protein